MNVRLNVNEVCIKKSRRIMQTYYTVLFSILHFSSFETADVYFFLFRFLLISFFHTQKTRLLVVYFGVFENLVFDSNSA